MRRITSPDHSIFGPPRCSAASRRPSSPPVRFGHGPRPRPYNAPGLLVCLQAPPPPPSRARTWRGVDGGLVGRRVRWGPSMDPILLLPDARAHHARNRGAHARSAAGTPPLPCRHPAGGQRSPPSAVPCLMSRWRRPSPHPTPGSKNSGRRRIAIPLRVASPAPPRAHGPHAPAHTHSSSSGLACPPVWRSRQPSARAPWRVSPAAACVCVSVFVFVCARAAGARSVVEGAWDPPRTTVDRIALDSVPRPLRRAAAGVRSVSIPPNDSIHRESGPSPASSRALIRDRPPPRCPLSPVSKLMATTTLFSALTNPPTARVTRRGSSGSHFIRLQIELHHSVSPRSTRCIVDRLPS